ncbi:MAG: hypothetical protein Kow0099_02050 [Candidatus Abyssubacteria bacterium]
MPRRNQNVGLVFILLTMMLVSAGTAQATVYVTGTSVGLMWADNPEDDVQGYEVHRGVSVEGPYAKVHSGLIAETSWTDTTVSAGAIYYYKLRAVDVCGNMSDFSEASDAVAVSDGDFDDDGFADDFEQVLGTDPLVAGDQPSASVLTVSPQKSLLRPGFSERLAVVGIFELSDGGAIEYDMTCIVQYQTDPVGVVSVDGCGVVTGQSEGGADVWAWHVVNGETVSASNIAAVTVDGTAPYVSLLDTHPYEGQGIIEDTNGNGLLDAGEDLDGDGLLDEDRGPTPRVPTDTGIVVRVIDDPVGENFGVDISSIRMKVNGLGVPVKVRQVGLGDSHEVDIAFRNSGEFLFDEIINFEVSLSDAAGNAMRHEGAFKVESEAEHLWALAHRPVQKLTVLDDGRCELSVVPIPDAINDEALEGAKLVYDCSEPVPPRFGPVDELPAVDIAAPVGAPLNLEPANVSDYPVTVVAPVSESLLEDVDGDGAPDSGLEEFDIYQYTGEPSALWRSWQDTSGWMEPDSRLNHYDTVPPSVEVKVNRFSGLHIGGMCLAPVANFSFFQMQIAGGVSVQFQDESTGTVSSWLWDFGDGTVSVERNPSHVYASPGDYAVTLTVSGPCGSDTKAFLLSTCEQVHLLAPADRSRPFQPPTLVWSPGCDTHFMVEFSLSRQFSTRFESAVLTSPSYTIDDDLWGRLPARTWIYWRVKSWNGAAPSDVRSSAEEWSFRR